MQHKMSDPSLYVEITREQNLSFYLSLSVVGGQISDLLGQSRH